MPEQSACVAETFSSELSVVIPGPSLNRKRKYEQQMPTKNKSGSAVAKIADGMP